MNEIIEKLKDKNYVRPFGLMTPEEQECFRKVGIKSCETYNQAYWQQAVGGCMFEYDQDCTYAIKPDYQPEPEYVDWEIVKGNDNFLGIHRRIFNDPPIPFSFTHLHCVPSLSGFNCFWHDEGPGIAGKGYMHKNSFWSIGLVSPKKAEGKKVYARFRK